MRSATCSPFQSLYNHCHCLPICIHVFMRLINDASSHLRTHSIDCKTIRKTSLSGEKDSVLFTAQKLSRYSFALDCPVRKERVEYFIRIWSRYESHVFPTLHWAF